jgi:hypothetical protein
VFPEFSEWLDFMKESNKNLNLDKMLSIPCSKVGAIRSNTKYSYPSDNSVIRVDKYEIGCKRMGESQIIKDNYCFGITQRKQENQIKVEGEDSLRNRDAK